MLELIYKYGNYFITQEQNLSFLDLLPEKYTDLQYILEVGLSTDRSTITHYTWTEGNTAQAVKDACFFQNANFMCGAGVPVYVKGLASENRAPAERKKLSAKIHKMLDFFEADIDTDKLMPTIEQYAQDYKTDFFIYLTAGEKTPKELISDKAEQRLADNFYKPYSATKCTCHLCQDTAVVYQKIGYTFFTNDKENYGCTDTFPYLICATCLKKILLAKNKIEDSFTGFWCGTKVMILPHEINQEIFEIFDTLHIAEEQGTKLLRRIRGHEEDLLDALSCESFKAVDILFFIENNSETKLHYHIQDVLPSQFNKLFKTLQRNELQLYSIATYLTQTDKQRMRLLDTLLKSKPYSRHLFFKNIMTEYKKSFVKGYSSFKTIKQIYNVLIDQNCLQGGSMSTSLFTNHHELFEAHPARFASHMEKAWFLLGHLYNYLVYASKEYHNKKESPYEKSLMLNATFNNAFFTKLIALCEQKLVVYGKMSSYIRPLISELSSCFSKGTENIDTYEAKFLFFWGYSERFVKPENTQKQEDNSHE